MSDDKNPESQSKPKPEESQEIVYYYSREQRLKRASSAVRELNEAPRKTGLVKSLAGNRGNLLVLMSILIIAAMYIIGARFKGAAGSEFTLGSNTVSIQVFEEETVLFLSVRKTTAEGAYAYTGAVDIMVSPIISAEDNAGPDQEVPILQHRVFFSLDSPETYLVSLPFTDDRFIVILQTETEAVTRTIRARKTTASTQ